MLRDYQKAIAQKASEILSQLKIIYLAMEVRTGKTITAFATIYLRTKATGKRYNVLFVTKKKAIESINRDFRLVNGKMFFDLTVINYESLHKLPKRIVYDLVIADEAHSIGAFPKPSQRTTRLKERVGSAELIYLSGTPTPESYSQLFHQFWVSEHSPFKNYKNFYGWASSYVNIHTRFFGATRTKDYSNAIPSMLKPVIETYFITFSQVQAGFAQEITEKVHYVEMNEDVYTIADAVIEHGIYTFDNGDMILADSPAKQLQKLRQIYSGTCKLENELMATFDTSKVEYIKKTFAGQKIAIYYVYILEGHLLRESFPNWTDSPEDFNESNDKVFICQIQSGSMGVNLSTADSIVFYNIDYSALQYWQARARMQSKDRTKDSIVHWIFSENGIEEKIYEAVQDKKDYTLEYFRQDYGIEEIKNVG